MSELDPLLGRAFSAARAERPRSLVEGKARTLAALGIGGSPAHGSSPSASASAPESTTRLVSWSWWSIVLTLLATGAASTGWSAEAPAPAPSVPSAPVTAAREAPTAPQGEGTIEAAAAPTFSVDELPNVVPVAARRPTAAASSTTCATCNAGPVAAAHRAPVAAPAASSSLRDEIEAIERASRALSQRQCTLAGLHLADYRAKFPAGRLQREADVVEIEIIGRSGHSDRARAAARRFVERFPDSPYALRLAPWLNDDGVVVKCTDATR